MQEKMEFIINTFLKLSDIDCKVINTSHNVEISGKTGSIFNRKRYSISIKDNPNNDETAYINVICNGINKSIDLQKNILFDILDKANLFDKNVIYGLNNIFWNYKISKQDNKIVIIKPKTNSQTNNECPYIGQTFNCKELNVQTMTEGKELSIKINTNYIEIMNEQIPCKFEKKVDAKYYFKGTEDLHQIIVSDKVITHTTFDGTTSYIVF